MLVILLGLAIGALVATYAYNEFYDGVAATEAFNESQVVMDTFAAGQTVNAMWDYIILMVLIGFAIVVVILGFFVDVHSIFFPIFVLLMFLGIGIAIIFDYVWTQVSTTTTFGTLASTSLPITNHIMTNLAMYFTIVMVMSMVALYAKTRRESEM